MGTIIDAARKTNLAIEKLSQSMGNSSKESRTFASAIPKFNWYQRFCFWLYWVYSD